MDTKTLLAFFLALPAGANADLTNGSALKQLRNKLALFKNAEMTPKDWENIQRKLTAILAKEKYAALNQSYQEIKAQLADIDITPYLLPTRAALEAAKPANRRIGTLGYPPGKPELESNEIINIGIVILSNEKPAKTAKTLLWRLINRLKRQPKTEPTHASMANAS